MLKKIFNYSYLIKFFKDSLKAFRLPSLMITFNSILFGIIAAYKTNSLNLNSKTDISKIFLLILAGLLLQCGANLINDYFEGNFKYNRPSLNKIKFLGVLRSYFDIYIFLLSVLCFAISGIIGIYLTYHSNIELLYIGAIGLFIAYSYTGEPFVLKNKGLGVIFSFIAIGPLMILGSYFIFANELNIYPILFTLPASLIIPALMISNELSDYKKNKYYNLRTLCLRIGISKSIYLYKLLLLSAYSLTFIYIITDIFSPTTFFIFTTIPLAILSTQKLYLLNKISVHYTYFLYCIFCFLLIFSIIQS
ncbi:MAG: prenyltransferase [Sarcina sp.]